MKKKIVSLLLALVMCLGLLPVTASAAEANLPDWYFLFAIFKNVDADCKDRDGKTVRAKYTMTQEEIDFVKEDARDFEAYMNQVGVMRAHVEVVEINAALTELTNYDKGGYLSPKEAAPLLRDKVDLDRYDHITCLYSLNVNTDYLGRGGSTYENSTGHTGINLRNREYCLNVLRSTEEKFPVSMYVHEFLHFMENMDKKWGAEFGLHDIRINHYSPDHDNGRACYTDIILNQARGTAGTGVHPIVWQYSPRVLRSINEWNIPSGSAAIGAYAFQNYTNITKLVLPGSVASIGKNSFQDCTNLKDVSISSGTASIGDWAFGCYETRGALERVSIPASVASIGYAAFYNNSLTDVYYGGTEEQWKAIQIGEYNETLTRANIHYNHLMADVKTDDWFAKGVTWAVENGITAGTGAGKFSPNSTCAQAQILTFLWRAYGSPEPSGKVSGSEYYAVPLQWAREQGVISGSLDPNSPCTRADVVTYLWRLAGSPTAKAASFSDVPASASYAGAVSWAVEQGITSGTSATTFGPNSACTRGQIVTFLRQALAG